MGKEMVHIPKEELKKLYLEEKKPMSEITKIFDCTLNTVALKLRKYGIKSRTTSEAVKLFAKKTGINIPKERLIELYKEKKLAPSEIAKLYNCKIPTVIKNLKTYRIPIKKSKGTIVKISERQLEYLYKKKKLTTYDIAELYGCCQATIWKRLRQFKIKARTRHELYPNVPSKRKLIELYKRKKLSTWEIERRYGYSRTTVHRKLREYGIKIRNIAESHIRYARKDFSGNLIEKAYLIGFRIGDLRVRKIWENGETVCVDCGSTRKEQIELIERLFGKYGRIWISKPKSRGRVQIQANLNLSFLFLLDTNVPNWVLENRKHFFSFLAGFTDAEGNIGIYGGQARYGLVNYDDHILFLIKQKLNEFGIECTRPYESDTSKYITPDGYGHNQNLWSLYVHRKYHLLKLFDKIQNHLKHEKRLNDLSKAKRNIIERNKKFGNLMMRPKWRM